MAAETLSRTVPGGRPRTVAGIGPRAAAALVATAVLLLLMLCLLVAAPAAAGAVPGSPLDAYDKQIDYDAGVHKIARLAALISYTLMVSTVLLGVVLRMRYFQQFAARPTVHGAHMGIALSALIFGGIHGLTFLYQPVWDIGTAELLVPFTGGLQRIPVGFGIVGTELGIAVGCSVWLQRRLAYRRWLKFHQLGYAAFALIWLHVFTVHPEPRHLDPVAVLVALGAGVCLLAFLIRVLPSESRLRSRAFGQRLDAPR
ncbi:ferric reductase-like transmembrane domain-containing protein [Kitasatospora sp. NPDC059571]|uniref:ferric reductase-like transmembrane domain-containing protein n=1 Tax=Kitasatospora sp. NPDC059571 TaxID=3346871 RepID=UPI00368EDC70